MLKRIKSEVGRSQEEVNKPEIYLHDCVNNKIFT